MGIKNFNENHPEVRDGEVFLCNTISIRVNGLNFKTKRMGVRSYNNSGQRLPGLRPVFISESESEEYLNRPEPASVLNN